MSKLQFSPAATITPNAQGIMLQSDLGVFQLHGKDISDFISRIMPLLKGEHDQQAICDLLPNYDNSSVVAVLDLLKQRGLLEEVKNNVDFSPPWPLHERFLNVWSSADKQSTQSLANKRILVLGLSPWAITMVDELAKAGLSNIHLVDDKVLNEDDRVCHTLFEAGDIGQLKAKLVASAVGSLYPWCHISYEKLQSSQQQLDIKTEQAWDLVVVSFSNEEMSYLRCASDYIQQGAYKALYGSVDGLESCIGPVVIPDETACWNCARLRRLGTSESPQLAHQLDKSSAQNSCRARSMLSPMSAIVGHQLAMESLKLLLNYTPTNLKGALSIQNLVTMESQKHTIIPMPWCEVCGGAEHLLRQTNMPEQSANEAEYQVAMSAVSTVATPQSNPLNNIQNVEQFKTLMEGWINPITGVVRQLTGHVPSLPEFPVTASAGLSAFSAGEYDPRAMGQVGSGKGLDEVSAHIGAFGEAIERYSAARFKQSSLKYASISQLSDEYIDPESLVLYSKKQYHSANFAFSPWKRKQKIHWTKGQWLASEKPVWVPALVSYFNFSAPFEEQFSQVSSNGLAAGQSLEDAGIRACYELIERDAMMLTWYAQLDCQRLHINTQSEFKMDAMIADLTDRGVELELYLLDVGVHVPTVVCLALGDGYTTPAVSVALATHGDINVAMRKALLEQGHVLPYLCHLMRSGQARPQHVDDVTSLEDHAAYYFSNDKKAAFDFMRSPLSSAIETKDWPYGTIDNALDLRQRLQGANVDVAIVDVTSPDVALSPFSVARAVGVYMQPIHFGEQFKRVDNPRLRKLLKGSAVNHNPHPIA